MASISNQPGGRRVIQFVGGDGKRRTIRLGKVPLRTAELIKGRVEHLLAAVLSGTAIDSETARWLASVDDPLIDKLANVGLCPPRAGKSRTPVVILRTFCESYIAGRADLKSATKVMRSVVINDLAGFFGEACDVRTITPGLADDFKQHLIGRKLASTTVHKRLQVARSLFHAMKRRKLIDENPFDGVSAPAAGTRDRQRFITREETSRLLEACPNATWRTILALARFGGLRTPSETLSLKWTDIDWEASRIVVTSPKTEHHPGRGSRTIPLFPELRAVLAEAFELAPDGVEYVVDEKYRQACIGKPGVWMNANLRTTMTKIIRRAGLEPWPRLFHNLRASRETELVEKYPVQVVTDWLGNTPRVAMRHYLMTTETHFASAVQEPAGKPAAKDENDAVSALQNPVQYVQEMSRTEQQAITPSDSKGTALLGVATSFQGTLELPVAGTGFEPATSRL